MLHLTLLHIKDSYSTGLGMNRHF